MNQSYGYTASHSPPQRYKSIGEQKIADALARYGLPHIYEPQLNLHDGKRVRSFRPDFYLPQERLYIEYHGRIGDPDYADRNKAKLAVYGQNQVNYLQIYPWQLVSRGRDSLDSHLERLTQTSPSYSQKAHYRRNGTCVVKNGYGSKAARGYRPC